MDMAYENLNTSFEGELEEKGYGGQKICVSDHQVYGGNKSDRFVVDMQRFSHHLTEKDADTANSRISRKHSMKGSLRGDEKKIDPITRNEKDASRVATSPKAALHRSITPEKPGAAIVGSTDHSINPQIHHQITIMNGSMSNRANESKFGGKRLSLRRSSPLWTADPRKILFFFATLSSMGTILLIYFTLSVGKLNGDGNALD
ncbi:Hypothetical predicted protein [Olea europaea subsp. europaea]|uniref:Transmembrane protein n=1 Tax=Olea europaea subsp. europaea TaxID=158383 RepID=A0A8S0S4B8_OLEEU|nr:Hypothetical predicted protein [Olea europaea subsp. europaea]